MDASGIIFWPLALAALAVAALEDLKHRLIPNPLVLVVLCTGLALRISGGLAAAGVSLGATAIIAGLLYLLADHDYMGWGDAKMIAAASLLVPPQDVAPLIFFIVFAGGLLSCLYLLARLAMRHGSPNDQVAVVPGMSGRQRAFVRRELARIVSCDSMPYGIAILGGTSFWLLNRVNECSFATYCSSWGHLP